MIQELKYNGITTVPSDYECSDGDMSGMINAVIEDGVVRPLCPPTPIYTPPSGFVVKYIHKVNNGERTNYILTKGKGLYYENNGKLELIADIGTLDSIQALGNTLVVISTTGTNYILWDIEEQAYKYLGTHIPHLDISFGLQGHVRFFSMSRKDGEEFKGDQNKITNYGWLKVEHNDIKEEDRFKPFSDENKKTITDQVLAKVNLFISQQTVDKGRFCFPFFVRYALRLYDGTLVNHSAPILMMPSTNQCPVVFCVKAEYHEDNHIMKYFPYEGNTNLDIMLVASDLDYKMLSDFELTNKWNDIVKSVAIYISKPIYTYDQNGECKSLNNSGFPKTSFLGKVATNGVSSFFAEDKLFISSSESIDNVPINNYYEWRFDNLFTLFNPTLFARETASSYEWWNGRRNAPEYTLDLPLRKSEDIAKDIRETNTFYLIKEIPLEDLANNSNRTKIEIPEAYLQSLANREVMTDDYLSNDKLMPKYAFVYNQRLSLANVSRQLYNGYNPCSMLTYIQGAYTWSFNFSEVKSQQQNIKDIIEDNADESQNEMDMYTYVKDAGVVNVVKSSFNRQDMTIRKFHRYGNMIWGNYLFYPNTNAYKFVICNQNESPIGFETKPTSHDFLNGAFAYLGLDGTINGNSISYNIITTANPIVSDPNKVYTSEITNPFYFPVTGINTIGTGEILGISSAVKALSQGQFGQFPMYVFATDGVWALETSASGTFNAKQPVTRDVCICPESITQVDGAVLFATDRGIMMLQGSTANCISLDLDKDAQDLTAFPQLIELLNKHQYPIPSVDSNFKEYVKDCRMVYDYVNQRIIVARPNATYAYVYSLKSNKWGIMESTIMDSINSYPEAYAVGTDGRLLDFSHNPTTEDTKVTLITRPIKFDAPNELKTIRTIVQRGMIERRDVKFILYGSRDLVNWYALASTTTSFLKGVSGTPYKYFRLAIMADLKEGKSIYGATMDVNPKYNNRIR